MTITLTKEQQDKLLTWAGRTAASEVSGDMEPSGYTLEISISPFGYDAEAVSSGNRLELGTVQVLLI